MRLALALLLVGCTQPDPGPGTWTDPPTGDPPGYSYGCQSDAECSPNVCARDGSCQPAANLVTAHVAWTVQGQPASASTCTAAPDLDLELSGVGVSGFGFEPVPCAEGKFTVTKLPKDYDQVRLFRVGATMPSAAGFIDATSQTASLDLVF